MDSFNTIKKAYIEARELERKKIIRHLKTQTDENGNPVFKVSAQGGMGSCKYGEKKLKKAFDLSNWKWITTTVNNKTVLISLQSFETDNDSGNIHVLYDRIGLYFYDKTNKESKIKIKTDNKLITVSDPFIKMEATEFDLPLSEEDLENLTKLIIYKCTDK